MLSPPSVISNVPGLKSLSEAPAWPEISAVYFLCSKDTVVYVGQSHDVSNRLRAHTKTKKFDSAYYKEISDGLRLAYENAFIWAAEPELNQAKSPYITPDIIADVEAWSGCAINEKTRAFIQDRAESERVKTGNVPRYVLIGKFGPMTVEKSKYSGRFRYSWWNRQLGRREHRSSPRHNIQEHNAYREQAELCA